MPPRPSSRISSYPGMNRPPGNSDSPSGPLGSVLAPAASAALEAPAVRHWVSAKPRWTSKRSRICWANCRESPEVAPPDRARRRTPRRAALRNRGDRATGPDLRRVSLDAPFRYSSIGTRSPSDQRRRSSSWSRDISINVEPGSASFSASPRGGIVVEPSLIGRLIQAELARDPGHPSGQPDPQRVRSASEVRGDLGPT